MSPASRAMHRALDEMVEQMVEANAPDASVTLTWRNDTTARLTLAFDAPTLVGTDLYTLVRKGVFLGLRCATCGLTSFNPHDVRERFCGKCHLYLETPPP